MAADFGRSRLVFCYIRYTDSAISKSLIWKNKAALELSKNWNFSWKNLHFNAFNVQFSDEFSSYTLHRVGIEKKCHSLYPDWLVVALELELGEDTGAQRDLQKGTFDNKLI